VNQPASAKASAFIESVLRLQPKTAVFDCDGTLWSGDAGEGFFSWELERGVFSSQRVSALRERYRQYRTGAVSEDEMCGEMVTLHEGLRDALVAALAEEFFAANFVAKIFPEMRLLIERLERSGCEIWACSSTNQWVIEAAMQHFRVPRERILAASVQVENGLISDRLIRVPSGPGKPRAILEVLSSNPDAAFGNSRWDEDMLELARHAFAINPNADLEKVAGERGWSIYRPASDGPS
jgi:phosphoserine phosphatase